jgi:hypothetical protein
MRSGLTRRQAVAAVGIVAANLWGKLEARAGQREMVLPLDGLAGITVKLRGREVFIRSDELFAVLSGGKG